MFFKSLDLTTALRPSLLPDETLLFVQDAVGLYEGRFKVPNYQNGHAYLTSHRVCYVAIDEPRKYSVAIDLKEIDRADYQVWLMVESVPSFAPELTLFRQVTNTPVREFAVSAPGNPIQAAGTEAYQRDLGLNGYCFYSPCGIKPPFTTVLKAAITAAASREAAQVHPASHEPGQPESNDDETVRKPNASTPCPRCTFVNHPYLLECEICGAPLAPAVARGASVDGSRRSESPAPVFGQGNIANTETFEVVKLSFRGGGEKTFYERLKGALVQRKWLLYDAPPVPQQPSQSPATPNLTASGAVAANVSTPAQPRSPAVGIAGLEQRGLEARRNNEVVIGSSFEDLEALMASAKRIINLAETLARESGMAGDENTAATNAVLSESAAALGMTTTKDMLGSGAENLYLSELSRDLAEYLTDDNKGILQKEGGIMSLVDLWAMFNRSRNGVELVSPSDFQKAAELWEKLKLPVRLRRFKSGLLVVQRYDWNDEKTIRQLQEWMAELRQIPPADPVPWDWRQFGRAVTAQEAAQRFKWSVGVAAEELEMAEDKGVLCREEGIEGLRFWSNYITSDLSSMNSIDSIDLRVSSLAI
ncbi:hypothetical protein KXV67_006924 [Aspergillus fumigatus]|nr:hypothetical protein KXV67_006924 [Aspergillus fumigatus]